MEVTQDAFLKAFDKLETLTKPERFGSWLLRIVSNLSLNKRRRRALRRTASLDVTGDEDDTSRGEQQTDTREDLPDEITSGAEARDLLDRELAKLPEKQRRALVLFSMEKMPQKEVAKLLKISVEAVKWHVFTARKKLKERLREYL
jgi:RNA polymerase sigma-70 factor (ECF subfamily)